MSVQTTLYQRLFHRDLFLQTLNHQTRSAINRRHFSNRICCIVITVLAFYIGWNISITPFHFFGTKIDPAEELAYRHALNRSSPILQNTQICSLDEVDLLFVIISTGGHFLERQAIRETWGSMPDLFDVHSQRLFVIGYQQHSGFYRDLVNEASHEHDLLYLTVGDHSTTMKELQAYRWLETYCSKVQYVFKTEDDLFVNSPLLHELVRELKTKPNDTERRNLHGASLDIMFHIQTTTTVDKFLFGWAYQAGRPERNNTGSPYRVSFDEYPKELYPRYCSGFGYFMNYKTRNVLTSEGFNDQYPFRFADIYITGILPERLNFVCEIFPFTYYQGSTDDCIQIITKNRINEKSTAPLLICSTGRHVGKNAYTDYYKLWSELRQSYADKIQPKSV